MIRSGFDVKDLVRAAARIARALSVPATGVTIDLASGGKIKFPVPHDADLEGANSSRDTVLELPKGEFVQSAAQKVFTEAMKGGRALKTTELQRLVKGGKSRVYPKNGRGGIKELVSEGIAGYHDRLGYYLVDDPPAELKEG